MKPEKFLEAANEHPEYAYLSVPAAERYYEAVREPLCRQFLLETAKNACVENGTANALFFALRETGEEGFEAAILKEGKKALEVVEDVSVAYKVQPFFMAYDTAYAKKEHYAKVVGVFQSMELSLDWDLVALIDVISVMSPEIYEHYRALQELFRMKIKAVAASVGGFEKLVEQSPLKRAMAGYVILSACENRTLLAEKYQEYGVALWESVKDLEEGKENMELLCLQMELAARVQQLQAK